MQGVTLELWSEKRIRKGKPMRGRGKSRGILGCWDSKDHMAKK